MGTLENFEINESEKENEIPEKCGICGDPHYYRNCKYVIITSKMADKKVPTRARLSLPDILEIKKLADETYSVFTRSVVEVGTEFGPFVAQKNVTLHPFAIFPIKVFINNKSDLSEYYLDTTDENECCWMMFVQPASDVEEQNLICYQEGKDIFFGAIRDIHSGEELKVWYSPYCAFNMQKNTLTFKDSSKLQIESDIDKGTDDLNVLIKEQQKIIPRVVWNCKFCYKLEKHVTDFAKHLLTHYISHKKKTCQYCQKLFRYTTDYDKHLKLFHGESVNKPEKSTNTPQVTPKAIEHSNIKSQTEIKKNTIGGPLLLQCLTDSLDNSNSFLQQPEVNLLDLENYDNQNVLFDSDHLRLNVDIIGTSTIKDILDNFNLDAKVKDTEKKDYVCDICLRKFSTLRSISVHLKLHIGKYFCSSCKKVFGRAENYKQHKCNQIYSLKCPKCERIFYQKKYLVKHVSLYHDKKYACAACQKNYYSSTELQNHYCKKAPKDKRPILKCTMCTKSFHSKRGLKNHTKSHLNTTNYSIKYICSECSATFSSKDIYHRHVMAVHNKSRGYDCRICDKVFHRSDILQNHLLNIHGLGQTGHFKCTICKKEFKSKKYLNGHVKLSHDFTKFSCKLCKSSFKYSRNLLRHVKLVHNKSSSSEEMHECPICHNKVKLKNSLQRHIRRKHPERYKNLCIEINAKKDEIKHLRYKCPICNHEVKLKSSLQRHMSKKHPKDYKSLCNQLNETAYLVNKEKKETKLFDDEFDNYMDLQKTIENMDFNLDTCNDNLLSGSETIDKFLKESSDQISILFADSPKAVHNVNDIGTTIITDRITNREVGLSMPDLSEIEQEIRIGKNSGASITTNVEPQMTINSSDVVLYVLNDKGN